MSLTDGSRVPTKEQNEEEAIMNLANFSGLDDVITSSSPPLTPFTLFPFVKSSMRLIIDIHCASLVSLDGVCYGQSNIDMEECFREGSLVYCQSYWKTI